MAATILFQNFPVTASVADTARLVSFSPGQDWVAVGVIVSSVSGAVSATFSLQWSLDGTTWTTDSGAIATVTAPGSVFSGKRPLQGFYFRLAATVTGSGTVTCTGGAIY